MDVSPAAEQTVMVQLIRQPACAAEEEETQFQSDMVDNGARMLREYFDPSEIQTGDIILSIERRSCQFKSRSDKLEETVKYRDDAIKNKEKEIADLLDELRPIRTYRKVSEYLRYFGDTVVLPAIKKECKLATTDILSRVNNWNELLQYLGPFRGRTPEKEQLQNNIYEVVRKHGISKDQWFMLYDMNRIRNHLCHGPVNPRGVRKMVHDVEKLRDKEYTAAADTLASAIESLSATQNPYSTLNAPTLRTPKDRVEKYPW